MRDAPSVLCTSNDLMIFFFFFKLVQRTVEFEQYWYRVVEFWYRYIPSSDTGPIFAQYTAAAGPHGQVGSLSEQGKELSVSCTIHHVHLDDYQFDHNAGLSQTTDILNLLAQFHLGASP